VTFIRIDPRATGRPDAAASTGADRMAHAHGRHVPDVFAWAS